MEASEQPLGTPRKDSLSASRPSNGHRTFANVSWCRVCEEIVRFVSKVFQEGLKRIRAPFLSFVTARALQAMFNGSNPNNEPAPCLQKELASVSRRKYRTPQLRRLPSVDVHSVTPELLLSPDVSIP